MCSDSLALVTSGERATAREDGHLLVGLLEASDWPTLDTRDA